MDIVFHGAAREVTGSCHLVRANGRQLLIDCGLIQGSPKDEARNREPFPFNARNIDAVVLTHAHLDHSGRLPLLMLAGYRGPIYAHSATIDLCRIMLRDAAYLNEKETQWTNRKRARKGLSQEEPLYTAAAVLKVMKQFRALDYHHVTEILPGLRVELHDAGHILGSSIVRLQIDESGLQRTVVFSGDLGHRGAPILRDPEILTHADVVVMESTYGDRLHRTWSETDAELAQVLREAAQHAGNILIPAFAVGRTQELLYTMARNYHALGLERWTIFLDSPLAIEATEVYTRHHELYDAEAQKVQRETGNPFLLPRLHFSRTPQQSQAINRIDSGAIIIAGSGMCDGGRIKHHLKHHVWRANCHVVITGYQARGTPGRALVDGAKYIRLWGETVRVAAHIHTIGGFSAHADQAGLLEWQESFKPRPLTALVHGENGAQNAFADLLRSRGTRCVIPERGAILDLGNIS